MKRKTCITCPECKGSGKEGRYRCSVCEGRGRIEVWEDEGPARGVAAIGGGE